MKTSGLETCTCNSYWQYVVRNKFCHDLVLHVLSSSGWTSDDRKRGRYEYAQNVQLYAFPSKKKTPSERKWLEPLRRDVNFVSSRESRICSLHSMNGKPTVNTHIRNYLHTTTLKRAASLLFNIFYVLSEKIDSFLYS